MRPGHKDAQYMFERMGVTLGYETRRSWSRALPTDGVWLLPSSGELFLPEAAAVAIEVAVSEGPKTIKGSIDILAEVSPALGILVIHEVEIRRGLVRKGVDSTVIDRRVTDSMTNALDRVSRHQQRVEVWSYAQLLNNFRLITGEKAPVTLARMAS